MDAKQFSILEFRIIFVCCYFFNDFFFFWAWSHYLGTRYGNFFLCEYRCFLEPNKSQISVDRIPPKKKISQEKKIIIIGVVHMCKHAKSIKNKNSFIFFFLFYLIRFVSTFVIIIWLGLLLPSLPLFLAFAHFSFFRIIF